ncbi:MAG: glycosyltransferase, partial [Rhizobiaceae bacterium]|nr:glycosyltransferase [Rhizobiaceae bacterium]
EVAELERRLENLRAVLPEQKDVADILQGLSPAVAEAIGKAALARVLAEHTYAQRAVIADNLFHDQHSLRRRATMRERAV